MPKPKPPAASVPPSKPADDPAAFDETSPPPRKMPARETQPTYLRLPNDKTAAAWFAEVAAKYAPGAELVRFGGTLGPDDPAPTPGAIYKTATICHEYTTKHGTRTYYVRVPD